jgi:hypothetical protein
MKERVMLELLLYCHMFAKFRYATEIAVVTEAVMDFIGRAKERHLQWLGSAAPDRREPGFAFGAWTERDVTSALDRLNAYVVSAA